LEELYVRQGEFEYCETDDSIAYYTQNSEEDIIIYSSDGDLTQLVKKNVKIYNPSHQKLYQEKETFIYNHEEILIDNVKLVKMFCGDSSDNIAGIKGMGIKRFLSFFPEAKVNKLSVEEIRTKTNLLFEQDKHNKTLANLLTGVTKFGVFGDEFYDINERIVSLDNPFLTDDAKDVINLLINETLDQEGRSYKNAMKMMTEDGLFNVLPKSDDSWIKFLNPFLRLTRKEKNIIKTKTIKVKNNE
jgi:5'-3' exonuclease